MNSTHSSIRSIDERAERELAMVEASFAQTLSSPVQPNPLASALAGAMTPFTAAEFDSAAQPHPHAFAAGEVGMFPMSEVTVIAAQGREGKTYTLMSIAAAYVRGKRLGGLTPVQDRLAIIYSAEDDRRQYARKLGALRWMHGDLRDDNAWCDHIIVPDLETPAVAEWRELVKVIDRRPMKAAVVSALIDTLRPRLDDPIPPGLLIFETASTLSDADEDNAGLKVFVRVLKQIARELGVAVVLVHHTSQASMANLSTLNIGVSDIRGATALVFNARQCFLLVSLGSEDDPFADGDARMMLRKLVAPSEHARITALICLDSSKAIDPAPIFFRWRSTPNNGPALEEIVPPASIVGQQWRKVLATLQGKRAEARASAKDAAMVAKVEKAIEAVHKLQIEGTPASARAVSAAAGHGAGWAERYLAQAVEDGRLSMRLMKIPHTRDETVVYEVVNDLRVVVA